MVWFQCEDCGENLKKPKLPNHFRICFAAKLSCIDCGEIFGQESVQGHTQCITEAEKYGPKGLGKAPNGATTKPSKDSKQQPDFDINVGLSERPPWFCSLCNTKATSKQTLLLHADGKKHRAKARAIHAAKQQSKQTEQPILGSKVLTENTTQSESLDNGYVEEQKMQDTPKGTENGKVPSKKKRKLDASEYDGVVTENGGDATDGAGNGVNQVESTNGKAKESKLKITKQNSVTDYKPMDSADGKEDTKQKIKWKKLIKSALKFNPDGVLKMRKLKKLVLKSLQESGVMENENQLIQTLEQKITSSSRFRIDGKYVHLVAKD